MDYVIRFSRLNAAGWPMGQPVEHGAETEKEALSLMRTGIALARAAGTPMRFSIERSDGTIVNSYTVDEGRLRIH